MANNYNYPTQVGVIKRPHTTFAVDAKLYAEETHLTDYPCFHKYFSIPFSDFNKIYDLNLMHLVGRIIRC